MNGQPYCNVRLGRDGIRAEDADDLALEIVDHAKRSGRAVLVTIAPDGRVWLTFLAEQNTLREVWVSNESHSIVGVYTASARVENVRDDMLAMPRSREDAA